jgi:hypothetical protein
MYSNVCLSSKLSAQSVKAPDLVFISKFNELKFLTTDKPLPYSLKLAAILDASCCSAAAS